MDINMNSKIILLILIFLAASSVINAQETGTEVNTDEVLIELNNIYSNLEYKIGRAHV